MAEPKQVPSVGLDMVPLLKTINDGKEAEQVIKIVENVMDNYRDAVFSALQKKQDKDNLHNLNSVCVALKMIHTTLKNMITSKLVAEQEIKNREEE